VARAQRRDSGGAGEPAGLMKMSTTMERYIELVKQYPGQEQVNLTVEIQVPDSWFGVGSMGSLTTTERREKYNAQAVEYSEVREFPGASRGARKTKEKAIRFICLAHAADEPNSDSLGLYIYIYIYIYVYIYMCVNSDGKRALYIRKRVGH